MLFAEPNYVRRSFLGLALGFHNGQRARETAEEKQRKKRKRSEYRELHALLAQVRTSVRIPNRLFILVEVPPECW